MAVPIEFLTLIFRKSELAEFPGGLDAFARVCDAPTYLEDEHLVRVAFMSNADADALLDRVFDVLPAERLSYVVLDLRPDPSELPSWLDRDRGSVWLAGTDPGPLVQLPRGISARFFQTTIACFTDALRRRGILVDVRDSGHQGIVDAIFTRPSTRIEAWLVADQEQLVGLLTQVPRERSFDLQQYEQLLSEIEVTLRELGWNGAG